MSKFETYFAQQAGDFGDAFKKDLGTLLKLTAKARTEVTKAAIKSLGVRTEREKRAVLEELIEGSEDESLPLTGPFQLLSYFAKFFAGNDPRSKDDPKKIASDLAKMDGVYPSDVTEAKNIFAETLSALKTAALSAKIDFLKRTYETGILPSFKGIGTTVELRGVQEVEFEFGDDVERYAPTFVGLVGLASIRINLEGSDPKFFYFQASDKELTDIIDALRATQKELRHLESTVKANVHSKK